MNEMKIGFEMRKIRLALEDISPMRQIKDLHKGIMRYKKILSSIKEVGLVEPLVVYPQKDAPGKYLLKNGHLRYAALKELGQTSADCISLGFSFRNAACKRSGKNASPKLVRSAAASPGAMTWPCSNA